MPIDSGFDRLVVARIYIQCFAIGECLATKVDTYLPNLIIIACYDALWSLKIPINRKNTQKPTDELYASFKKKFPDVGPGTLPTSSAASSSSTTGATTGPVMDQRCE